MIFIETEGICSFPAILDFFTAEDAQYEEKANQKKQKKSAQICEISL
jgi:hypothetical protein